MISNSRFRTALFLLLTALILSACGEMGSRTTGAESSSIQKPLTATTWPTAEVGELIYVLDLEGRGGALFSHLTAYNPLTNQIVFSLQTRGSPVPVLSPGGDRLFVADSYLTRGVRGEWRDVLSVHDARSGELLVDDHPIPGRALPKGAPVENMFMFFSETGEKLFLLKYGDPPDFADMRVAELDPLTLAERREFPWPSECEHLIQALETGWLCTSSATVVNLDPGSGSINDIVARYEPTGDVLASARSPDDEKIHLAVKYEAEISLVEVDLKSNLTRTLIELHPQDGWVFIGREFAIARNNRLLYIGAERRENLNGYPDQVWGLRIPVGDIVARIDMGGEIDDLLVDEGGRLYTLSGEQGILAAFDTLTQDRLATIATPGGYPAYLLTPKP